MMPVKRDQPRSKEQIEIKEHHKLIDMLKDQKKQYSNQLESIQSALMERELKRMILSLDKRIKKLESEVAKLIQSSPKLKASFDLITSIPGIGACNASKLLGQIINIDDFKSAKQFAAFIGLTPMQRQSGQFSGRTKRSKIGHVKLRNGLYMASLSARRYNPVLKKFADRLEASGKAPKAVLCAVMRKLAHIVFGVLKHKQPFKADYVLLRSS